MLYLLLLLGLLPYGFGWLLNTLVMKLPNAAPPFLVLGLLLLLVWAGIAWLAFPKIRSVRKTVALLNLVGAADLVLILIQELLLGAYWPNLAGSLTQFYFLPLLNIGFTLAHSVLGAYLVSYLLLLLAAYSGCKLRRKN